MELQLSLPLETDSRHDSALRRAWQRSGVRVPFHVALQDRALGICLRCLAEAMARRSGRGHRAAPPQRR